MPTVSGRRCPKCGGPVSTVKGGMKPLEKKHDSADLDTCRNAECGWASGKPLPDAKAADSSKAPEDVES
jgi:hypothetical protein